MPRRNSLRNKRKSNIMGDEWDTETDGERKCAFLKNYDNMGLVLNTAWIRRQSKNHGKLTWPINQSKSPNMNQRESGKYNAIPYEDHWKAGKKGGKGDVREIGENTEKDTKIAKEEDCEKHGGVRRKTTTHL